MALKEESRPELWTVLKRRKRSIRSFLENNQIDSSVKLDFWLKSHEHEYSYSKEFLQEVAKVLSVKKEVKEVPNALIELVPTVELVHEEVEEQVESELVASESKKGKKKKNSNGLESE